MRIQLNEKEVTDAIVRDLQNRGLNISGDVKVDFSMGRSPSVLRAEVIFGEDLDDNSDAVEAPADASASPAPETEQEDTSEDESDPLFDDD